MDEFITEGRPPRKYINLLKRRKLAAAMASGSRSDGNEDRVAPSKGYTPRSVRINFCTHTVRASFLFYTILYGILYYHRAR